MHYLQQHADGVSATDGVAKLLKVLREVARLSLHTAGSCLKNSPVM
jgi:hypothetical protein